MNSILDWKEPWFVCRFCGTPISKAKHRKDWTEDVTCPSHKCGKHLDIAYAEEIFVEQSVDDVCSICPTCGSDNTEPSDDGDYDCLNCGVFFDPLHPYVQEDQKRILEGKRPVHDVR